MKEEMDIAHKELERIQGIIARHEGHMFSLRRWFLAIVGGLLAAYFSEGIELSKQVFTIALSVTTFLILFLDYTHVVLIDRVVERAMTLEELIVDTRVAKGVGAESWYDGPQVCAHCKKGVKFWAPKAGMTLWLNLAYYVVIVVIVVGIALFLPS